MTLFPEIEATTAKVKTPMPDREDFWIVLAVSRETWSLPKSLHALFLSREAAEKAAENLASCWTHKRIVHIPGEIDDE